MEYSVKELKDYIHGLYWLGKEDYDLERFPKSRIKSLSEDMRYLSTNLTGARICFRAKTPIVGIEAEYPPMREYGGFSKTGQAGIDLYVDNDFYFTFPVIEKGRFMKWVETDESMEHEYTLYLPIYAGLVLHSLALEEAEIKPMSNFRVPKPVVFYGSSITHGAFASRPALTYPAIIGRQLNVDIINLGFAGSGRGETEVADLISEIDASCFVMDWGANLGSVTDWHLIKERYRPMLYKVIKKHPKTPIIIVNLQYLDNPPWQHEIQHKVFDGIRTEIKAAYDEQIEKGNKFIRYIDGYKILGPQDMDCGTVDRVHPNDYGFSLYVKAIKPVLKELLHI